MHALPIIKLTLRPSQGIILFKTDKNNTYKIYWGNINTTHLWNLTTYSSLNIKVLKLSVSKLVLRQCLQKFPSPSIKIEGFFNYPPEGVSQSINSWWCRSPHVPEGQRWNLQHRASICILVNIRLTLSPQYLQNLSSELKEATEKGLFLLK